MNKLLNEAIKTAKTYGYTIIKESKYNTTEELYIQLCRLINSTTHELGLGKIFHATFEPDEYVNTGLRKHKAMGTKLVKLSKVGGSGATCCKIKINPDLTYEKFKELQSKYPDTWGNKSYEDVKPGIFNIYNDNGRKDKRISYYDKKHDEMRAAYIHDTKVKELYYTSKETWSSAIKECVKWLAMNTEMIKDFPSGKPASYNSYYKNRFKKPSNTENSIATSSNNGSSNSTNGFKNGNKIINTKIQKPGKIKSTVTGNPFALITYDDGTEGIARLTDLTFA